MTLRGIYGISTWVYPSLPAQRAIERLSNSGIRFVEYAFRNIAMSSTDAGLRADYLAGKNAWGLEKDSIPVREIAQISNSCQVSPIQMHSPDYNLAWPDQARRQRAVEKTGIALDICQRLGAPILVVHPGIGDPDLMDSDNIAYDRARDDNLKSVGEMAKIARELGVGIALENRGKDIYGSRPGDLIEMASLDPDTLSVCIDTGHSNKLGLNPAQSIEEAGKFLGATHLHDNEGSSDQHLPLFSGGIEWNGVINALRQIGYEKPVIVEIRGDEDLHIGDNRVLLTGLAMAHLKLRPS